MGKHTCLHHCHLDNCMKINWSWRKHNKPCYKIMVRIWGLVKIKWVMSVKHQMVKFWPLKINLKALIRKKNKKDGRVWRENSRKKKEIIRTYTKNQPLSLFILTINNTPSYNFHDCFSFSGAATQTAPLWTTSSSLIDHHTLKVAPPASNTPSRQVILWFPTF